VSFSEQQFRELIAGQTSSPTAALARGGLLILEQGYRFGICCRNALFDLGIRTPRKVTVPVISVGNVTTGGTGKTPVVAWFVQQLQAMLMKPGIISRGYRAVDETGNDEKRVLEKLCPGVPHEQRSSRWFAAQTLLSRTNPANVIVMDDGFQHRQLHRNFNVLLIDATNPFGYNHLLPRGLLREPLFSMRRADVVIITRADMVAASALDSIRATIRKAAPKLKDRIAEMIFRPTDLVDSHGKRSSIDDLKESPVLLVSGIGNPSAFEATCRNAGLTVADRIWFPDHHHFTDEDLRAITHRAGDASIVVTLKDLVKLPQSFPARALNIAAETVQPTDGEMFQQLIRDRLG
jgi:tetraacyldisaccharide 4'-kinase